MFADRIPPKLNMNSHEATCRGLQLYSVHVLFLNHDFVQQSGHDWARTLDDCRFASFAFQSFAAARRMRVPGGRVLHNQVRLSCSA